DSTSPSIKSNNLHAARAGMRRAHWGARTCDSSRALSMTHPARKLTDASERFARARRLDPRAMPIRIVIADADTATRQRLRRALGVIDARVDEAGDGAELERLLGEDGPFDLVITSSQLPQQSGLSVLTRVRSRGLTTPF